MQLMDVDRHDTVLITGLGPVGLGGVINGVYRGARVIAVDSIPYRAEKALELGAAAVVNPTDEDALQQILDLTGARRGVDKAVDCSGVVAAHRLCIDAARRKGQVAFVGECGDDTPLRISKRHDPQGVEIDRLLAFQYGGHAAHDADDQRDRRSIGQTHHPQVRD